MARNEASDGNQSGYADNCQDSNEQYYPSYKRGKGKPATYLKRENIGTRIVWAFAQGKDTAWIIEKVKDWNYPILSKQLIQYYKELALSKGIIVDLGIDDDGLRYKTYGKGPNYHLLKYKDWTKSGSEPLFSRVHPANGNAINVQIKEAKTDKPLIVRDSNGELQTIDVFNKPTKDNGVFCTTSFQLLVPFEVVGYHGAYATLTYKLWKKNALETLNISPPEAHLTLDQLKGPTAFEDSFSDIPMLQAHNHAVGHEEDPFCIPVSYVLGVLEENGWEFEGWTNDHPVHYAFDARMVKKYYPAMLEGFPVLTGSNSEEDLVIYKDRSHGKPEIETTEKALAIEIMTLLEFTRMRLRGEREYSHSKYKKWSGR